VHLLLCVFFNCQTLLSVELQLTGMASGFRKFCAINPSGSFLEQVEEEIEGGTG